MTSQLSDEESSPLHQRPSGVTSDTVAAVGKVTEALETTVRARGHLFAFHQLTGSADLALGEAVALLRDAGHSALAERIDTELVGRNVLPGRWTFQIIEDYDDGYYRLFSELEQLTRDELVGGRRHLFEAEMKEDRRTHGREGHEAAPGPG
jgi:hypothetical protein